MHEVFCREVALELTRGVKSVGIRDGGTMNGMERSQSITRGLRSKYR